MELTQPVKNQLGNTGLQVTRLGYGAMEIRGEGEGRSATAKQAETILNAVLDAGINFVDTSIDYGDSEEHIGKFISHRRDEFLLASKCGCQFDAGPNENEGWGPHTFDRANIISGVEQSLRRMKTDYLDIVQFHKSPTMQQLEEHGGLDALKELQAQGKVRHIGVSGNFPEMPEQLESAEFAVLQIPYSALQRDHEGIITQSAERGIGTIIRGGLGQGDPDFSGSVRLDKWTAWNEAYLSDLLEHGESRTGFMLRFTLSHPDVDTVIAGTQNPEHLAENVASAARGQLSSDVYAEAKRRLLAAGQGPA